MAAGGSMAKRKTSARAPKGPAKKTSVRSKLQKRTVQDVYVGPTVREIEKSLQLSKTESLRSFRTKVGW
jgi:hypothetical protein